MPLGSCVPATSGRAGGLDRARARSAQFMRALRAACDALRETNAIHVNHALRRTRRKTQTQRENAGVVSSKTQPSRSDCAAHLESTLSLPRVLQDVVEVAHAQAARGVALDVGVDRVVFVATQRDDGGPTERPHRPGGHLGS